MGRNKLDPEKRVCVRVQVLLTPREKRRLDKARGKDSISNFIRTCLKPLLRG